MIYSKENPITFLTSEGMEDLEKATLSALMDALGDIDYTIRKTETSVYLELVDEASYSYMVLSGIDAKINSVLYDHKWAWLGDRMIKQMASDITAEIDHDMLQYLIGGDRNNHSSESE